MEPRTAPITTLELEELDEVDRRVTCVVGEGPETDVVTGVDAAVTDATTVEEPRAMIVV